MAKLARKAINKEKRDKTGRLDLSSMGLRVIPKEIESLDELEYLNLARNYIKEIRPNLYLPKLKSLNLLDNGLQNISELSNLVQLESLDLSYNYEIKDYAALQKLKKIRKLHLEYNYLENADFIEYLDNLQFLDLIGNYLESCIIQDKPNLKVLLLSKNKLTDISGIKKLPILEYAALDNNLIRKIEPIKDLRHIKKLTLDKNRIKNIQPIKHLKELEELNLSYNNIQNVKPICRLNNLKTLYLNNNQIENLGDFQRLKNLELINLKNNRINDLSPLLPIIEKDKIKPSIDEFRGNLELYGNPIQTPPLEIVKQGREAILEWFESNKTKLNEVKLILIGDPKSGKTSLLRRLKGDSFDENEPQTDGINIEDIAFGSCPIFRKEGDLKDITGHFWDFGGQEIMNSTHQFFLTNRSVYILVLNARNDKEVSNQIRHWAQRIQATGGNSPIIVVANQIDVNPGFGFENEANLRDEFPQIKMFLKVSCKEGENIQTLVSQLEEWIPKAEMFETEIDERWLPIKKQLEEETKGEVNKKGRYLDEPRFHEICESHGLNSSTSQDSLVKFLHDLGLLLHFEGIQENLSEYYVLDPYWITYGVYQILTSKYAGECKGIVPMAKLEYIVNEEPDKSQIYRPKDYEKIKYSTNQRRFLVDILHEFKLCFYVNDRQHFIIPDLLETNAPIEVTEPFRKSTQALRFIYQYTYIPSSIIPQIMVEALGILEHIWRTGCVLSHDDSRAMINAYQNQILIIVEGAPKKKREFLSIIRYLIDQINVKLSDQPKMLIPLSNLPSEYVSYKKLRSLEKRGERTYLHFSEVKDDNFEYSVNELLEGIAPITKDDQLVEEIQKLQDLMQAGTTKLDLIYEQQVEHYEYLKTNLPPDWDESLLDEISSLQVEQTEKIREELIKALAKAFELYQGDMDEQLKKIYLKMTEPKSLTGLKLKAGLPLLAQMVTGIGVEAEFDLKGWSEQMYKKYELQLFKVMGKIG